MARKAGDAKVRYVGFRIEADAEPSRQVMIQAIQHAGRALDASSFESAGVWLTRFDGRRGILRCHHHGVDFARDVLGRVDQLRVEGKDIPVRVETVGTSGTIRTLVERDLKDLEDRGQRRR